jgi:hypothetical protein
MAYLMFITPATAKYSASKTQFRGTLQQTKKLHLVGMTDAFRRLRGIRSFAGVLYKGAFPIWASACLLEVRKGKT